MIKIFCLPFAGAAFYSYQKLINEFDSRFEIICPEPPGRGERMQEALLYSLEEMIEDIITQIKRQLVLIGSEENITEETGLWREECGHFFIFEHASHQ